MSRNYVTDTINLNSYDLSENDKIIVMYSKEKGLIKAVAKGCKKVNSKLGATMQSLVANKIVVNKGKSLDIISQVESVDSFKEIKKDFDKLSFSMYCAEIVSNYGVEEDSNSENIYKLLYDALNKISHTENVVELLLAVIRFQLKIMNIAGFQICLNVCSNCGDNVSEENEFKFSVSSGGVLCKNCYQKLTNINGKIISIHPKVIKFLSVLETTDFNVKTRYDELADEKICYKCFNLIKDYISYYSSRKFKTVNIIEPAV